MEKVLFSKNTDDWKTPTDLYEKFMHIGCIDCFKYRTAEDEFKNNYENKKLFINPPFSKLDKVAEWLEKQIEKNKIYLLIPARTDTKYFHKLLKYRPLIIFIKGRLKYNDIGCATFPTILLVFNKKYDNGYLYMTQEELKTFLEYEDRINWNE